MLCFVHTKNATFIQKTRAKKRLVKLTPCETERQFLCRKLCPGTFLLCEQSLVKFTPLPSISSTFSRAFFVQIKFQLTNLVKINGEFFCQTLRAGNFLPLKQIVFGEIDPLSTQIIFLQFFSPGFLFLSLSLSVLWALQFFAQELCGATTSMGSLLSFYCHFFAT
jgi:hypothetical protein